MNTFEKEAWGRIREQGRDRFLVRSIGRAAWICAVVSVVINIGLLAFGQRVGSLWHILVSWVFLSIGIGAGLGFWRWDENENHYKADDEEVR
jgi:hypothetical protein